MKKKEYSKIFIFIFTCFAANVFFLSSCGRNPEKEINTLMDTREKAFSEKVLDDYLNLFSKDYKDNKGNIDSLKERMKKNFKAFDNIKFSHTDREIFVEENTAIVVQGFILVFSVNGKKRTLKGKEMFQLKRIQHFWDFLKGSSWLIVTKENK